MTNRYTVQGAQGEFQPGSNDLVLANQLGITSVEEMNELELYLLQQLYEEVLLAHPAVSEVAVIGQPDAEWGEVVIAFLVADGEPVPDAELDALCLAHIARFKRPKQYRWVPALPKNSYGKVLKTELRAQFTGVEGGVVLR